MRRRPLRRLLCPRGPVSSAASGSTARVGEAAAPPGSERLTCVGARRKPTQCSLPPSFRGHLPPPKSRKSWKGSLEFSTVVRLSWLLPPGNHFNPAAERAFLMTQPSAFPACLIFQPVLYVPRTVESVCPSPPSSRDPWHSCFPRPHSAGFADVFRLGEWAPQFAE